jgi:hypothetical protein
MKTLIDRLIGWPERVAKYLAGWAPLFARIVVGEAVWFNIFYRAQSECIRLSAHDGPLTKTCLNPARLLTPSAVQSLK